MSSALGKPVTASVNVVRDAMAADLTPEAQAAWLEDAAECVRRHGVIVIQGAIPEAARTAVLKDFQIRHDVHMAPGQTKLFRTFQDDPLRAQVPIAVEGPVADPAFFAAPSVIAMARKMMGEQVIIGEMGLVVSHAGAKQQATHRDSPFLFGGVEEELELPTFAMTVLIPLVDVPMEMGPVEFWPGSHRQRDQAAITATTPQRVALTAGSVVMLDSRMLHQGGANSGAVRPVAYFSYHRPWYLEHYGYEHKPQIRISLPVFQRLPEEYRSLFEWGLHLNRMGSVDEFVFRWTGRVRRRLMKLLGR